VKKKLTFGYLYDLRNPKEWYQQPNQFYAETLDFITWTEGLGFEGAWLPEHHLASDGYLASPLTMLAAIAARTKKIKLGTAIALAPLYHPLRFTEDCAMIDILSNGRLEMAVGIGYRQRETDAMSVPFKSRAGRTDEFIQLVRRLWAGETVTHESKHFSIKKAMIDPRPVNGTIPLYVGGFSTKALDRAVKYGDGYHGLMDMCPVYIDKLREAGKDVSKARVRALDMNLFVARDPAKAFDELAPHMLHMHNSYSEWAAEDNPEYDVGNIELKPMGLEEFRASGRLTVLTPAQAIEFFQKQLSIAPLEHFMLFVPPGMRMKQFGAYAELFAKEVMPAFA
jgi:alkanesulfonate monooxygenase SsuD/methylene tetrahydromethanopterin reductase-like flavin-dependent oxidoreductase (luciferase family)